MPLHPHLPHLLYSLAITSLSVHLVIHRRTARDQRTQISAQISLLDSISQQLQSNDKISPEELIRLRRLASRASIGASTNGEHVDEDLSWSDVVLGRKDTNGLGLSVWEERDLEQLRQELGLDSRSTPAK